MSMSYTHEMPGAYSEEDIIKVINDYLDHGMGSTVEQIIMRRAAFVIEQTRKERDYYMSQVIGEKQNDKRTK